MIIGKEIAGSNMKSRWRQAENLPENLTLSNWRGWRPCDARYVNQQVNNDIHDKLIKRHDICGKFSFRVKDTIMFIAQRFEEMQLALLNSSEPWPAGVRAETESLPARWFQSLFGHVKIVIIATTACFLMIGNARAVEPSQVLYGELLTEMQMIRKDLEGGVIDSPSADRKRDKAKEKFDAALKKIVLDPTEKAKTSNELSLEEDDRNQRTKRDSDVVLLGDLEEYVLREAAKAIYEAGLLLLGINKAAQIEINGSNVATFYPTDIGKSAIATYNFYDLSTGASVAFPIDVAYVEYTALFDSTDFDIITVLGTSSDRGANFPLPFTLQRYEAIVIGTPFDANGNAFAGAENRGTVLDILRVAEPPALALVGAGLLILLATGWNQRRRSGREFRTLSP